MEATFEAPSWLLSHSAWRVLEALDVAGFISEFRTGFHLDSNGNYIAPTAWVHSSALIRNSVVLDGVNIHEFVSIRDSIVCSGANVGHCCEVTRSIIGEKVSMPRFNYVGSSLIGERVRLGGVVSLASQRFDKGEVLGPDEASGVMKLGAMIGYDTRLGFAVHVNPGVRIGAKCLIGPYSDVRISIPSDSVLLIAQRPVVRRREGAHWAA